MNAEKRRCVVLHSPVAQKKELKEDFLETIEEVSKDAVLGLRIHVQVHKMNENNGTISEMVS